MTSRRALQLPAEAHDKGRLSGEYTTTDIQIAAFLTTKGHSLVRFVSAGPKDRLAFVFSDEDGHAAEEVRNYQNDALAPARALLLALRDLKAALYEAKDRVRLNDPDRNNTLWNTENGNGNRKNAIESYRR